ncbi:ribonuclease HII [Virgibacillus flavescens]|uniref:ribonuclease HII n=1 Tax=Virgibacillus flavescens TaxID=1611422 RepID=UPI003D34C889
MKNKSIAEIKQLMNGDNFTETELIQLKEDSRKGVQKLCEIYEKHRRKEQALENQFIEMSMYETKCYSNGCKFVAGIDEAGRGPLAGPVVAAAVILPRDFKLIGLDDSKQLNESKRHDFFHIIKEQAVSFGISIISNHKIDELNIYEATKLAMYDAISQLDPTPDHILIDAVTLDRLPCTSEAIIKGDQKSISIAAASILAKVTRDNMMKNVHKDFPNYDFASNMGYGTKNHLNALNQYGITPFHRKSFSPVRNIINH